MWASDFARARRSGCPSLGTTCAGLGVDKCGWTGVKRADGDALAFGRCDCLLLLPGAILEFYYDGRSVGGIPWYSKR